MQKAIFKKLVTLIALLTACSVTSKAQEPFDYVVTVGNETLTFVARPELGYVVKTQQKTHGIGTLNSTLSLLASEYTKPLRGLDRHGIWIVENEYPSNENNKTIGLLTVNNHVQYTAPLFSSNDETVAVIPEIVIRVRPGIEITQVQTLCEYTGCTIVKRMEFTEQEYLLEALGPDADAVFVAVEELSQNPEVEWACPNTASRLRLAGQVMPNDEYFSEQWQLYNTGQICLYGSAGIPDADINAPEAWEITTGDPNIVIAVLDTGVDTNHPDLINNLVPGYDFYEDDNSPDPVDSSPFNFHGTICAGLIAARGDNDIGLAGVTWICKVMPIRIARYDDWLTDADRAIAIRWAVSHGADVLSNSWGSTSPRPIIHSAIVDITEPDGIGRDGKGCIVLFAAGNDDGPLWWPARYPEVIAVGATDNTDVRSYYSNYGPDLNIVAPSGGKDPEDIPMGFLCSTDISGSAGQNKRWMPEVYGPVVNLDVDYAYMGGTSSACPVAAGVAALILSTEPDLTNEEVRHFLERSAKDLGEPGRDDYYGLGRVDARAALDMVLAKRADLNNDWKVDMEDLLILIEFWRTAEPSADIAPATKRDGIVDEQDVELLISYWQTEIPEMDLIDQ